MKRNKRKKARLAEHAFININETIMQDEHKKVLISYLKEMLIDVKDNRKDIDGLIKDMVIIIKSMQKLKKVYTK